MDPTLRNSQSSSFDELPEEVWVQIIKESVTDEMLISIATSQYIKYADLDRLLPLTLVSTAWRRRIEGAASLWTDILVDEENVDLAMKVTLCLHFSKAAPLSIYFRWSCRSWPLVAERIVSQRNRIQTIAIFQPHRFLDPQFHFQHEIWTVIQQLEPLTALTRLMCTGVSQDQSQAILLIEQHPSIVDVRGFELSTSTLFHDSRQWTHILSDEDPVMLFPALQSASSLKSVKFSLNYGQSVKDPAFTIRPLGWESLVYSTRPGIPVFLLHGLQSHLIHLEIATDTSDIINILPVLGDCMSLKVLKIKIYSDHSRPRYKFPGFSHLSDSISSSSSAVQLRMTSQQDSVDFVDPRAADAFDFQKEEVTSIQTENVDDQPTPPKECSALHHGNNVKDLTVSWESSFNDNLLSSQIEKFQKAMPLVSKFTLEGVPLYYASFLALHSWKHLDDLKIHSYRFDEFSALNAFNWEPPNTVRRFEIGESIEEFRQLRSSSVDSLHVNNMFDEDMNYFHIYDISQWPNIRSLRLEGLIILPCKLPLLYLRNLHISGHQDENDPVNRLCQQLAMDSSDLPVLEILHLDGKIEWDILFIFLERKNLSINTMISPISQLTIPRPNLTLEIALRQLLKRLNGKRLSNYDISWEGNAEILFDPSIPGCRFCHGSLRYCNRPVEENFDEPELSHLSYPDSENEILVTWESRRAVWHKLPGPRRAILCSLGEEKVTITDQSIEDPTYERGNEEPMLEEN